jgi:hypothetical protein
VYVAFAFGLIRDLWNPFGLHDRGYFLIFAPITALAFLWMEWSSLSYLGLLAGMLLAMLSFRFSMVAYQGLIALVGQEKLMSGRLSAIWLTVWNVISSAGAFGSGYLAGYSSPRNLFFLVAVPALLAPSFIAPTTNLKRGAAISSEMSGAWRSTGRFIRRFLSSFYGASRRALSRRSSST